MQVERLNDIANGAALIMINSFDPCPIYPIHHESPQQGL